ncbi:MAG: hypothetical protein JXR48_15080 [Candidatus Delongbacteria bacterium]|nr:hypothetical protein [Candidatus Delongbacteria bacterium]MBN2836280.1 hypothetical protein [Candidatus Delongbacteria bacterium]
MSFFRLVLLISVLGLISCGSNQNDNKKLETGSNNTIKVEIADDGPVSMKKYNTPNGADPKISSELGGDGFESIADSLGFITNDNFTPVGDSSAVKGGEFTFALNEFPATLRTDGKDSNSSVITMIGNLIYETLLTFDREKQQYLPGIASHWKIENDKQTFWFRIDPNARWSDGKPVVAEDILYTWRLHMDEGILSPYDQQTYGDYEEPEIISKYMIKVRAKKLNWRLFLYLSNDTFIFPAHHLKKIDGKGYMEKYQWKMLPGTGPYVLDEKNTIKGQKIAIRRRSDFWGENYKVNIGMNNFDKINIVVIRDEVLVKEKLKKGEIDFYNVNRAQWWVNEFNEKDPTPPFEELTRGLVQKKKVYNFLPKGVSGLAFNMRKAPFDDIRIRKAFAMLWNRDQLINTLFYNEYRKINSSFPGSIYENKENLKIEYNPTEANKLLDEAGWKSRNSEGFRTNDNGELLEIDFMIEQSSERIFTPYQEDLKKSGVKLNLKIADRNTMFQAVNERRFKIHYQSWTGAFFPNPESSLHSRTADPDNTTNITGFKNSRVDEISDLYNESFDTVERIGLIKELDKIVSENVHYAYGWYTPYGLRCVYWNKFGMPKSVIGYADDWRIVPKLWWYDKTKAEIVKKGMLDKSVTMPAEDIEVDFFHRFK